MRSFQAKLVYLTVAVLVLLQAATLIAVHVAGERTLRRSVDDELRVGSRVFDQLLALRGRQLSFSVRALASDFAFREAIASTDRPTIVSALANHANRVDADAVFLISLDGTVIADTLNERSVGRSFPLPTLVREAERLGESTAIVLFDSRPYQFVVVPILGPRPIAWVCMGFRIDEATLTEVRRLTSLDVSLWKSDAENPLLVSTLRPDERNDLVAQMRENGAGTTIQIGDDSYQVLLHPLITADRSQIKMLLQRSIEEARRPYRRLQLQFFAVSILALIVAVVAAYFFARGVSSQIQRLAQEAQKIEHGDYTAALEIRQKDEIGQLANAFGKMRTAIAEREEQIRLQATHDSLTGLPNRTLFFDRLAHAIEGAKRTRGLVGMIMMDLDRFKEINDTLGHSLGDDLLVEIGRRLRQTIRETDTVARLGGGEFAVMFEAEDEAAAVEMAQRLSRALETSFTLGGVSIDVNASMGIALYPLHAEDAGTLMKRADVAMYDAKKNHTAIALYEAGRDEHSIRRLSLLSELRQPVQKDELEIHYQPNISIQTGRAAYAEALVRWNHPSHGLMMPDEFIPLAEQSGSISALTKWVLRKAIGECAGWAARGTPMIVAVNLSPLDLFDAELPSYISGLLSEASLQASWLVLEITETAIMRDPAYALKILRDLKGRGIRLSIDDFGNRYSARGHLKRLPVDELKIDKSFVLNLNSQSTDDAVIVRSTIELGHNMGLTVIAEGVETIESLDILTRLGCDMAQGYYMSPPLPAAELLKWMTESRWGVVERRTV